MNIYVLVGMIASGKTTYARRRADEGALVVCFDSLTEMLHARYRYEQDLRECYRRMEECLVLEAIRAGRDAVIDRTHLTKDSRLRWINFMPQLWSVLPIGAERPPLIAVAFPILSAEVHARRRFEADPRGRTFEDWLKVAEHHAAQAAAEPLELGEGFDLIRYMEPHP